MSTDLAQLSVHALAAKLKSRSVSPVDIVGACLERIATLDPKLHAFVEVYDDGGPPGGGGRRQGHPLRPRRRAAARHSDRAQGSRRARGPRGDRRHGGVARPPRHPHRHTGAKADQRRHDRHRQDAHGGVRLRRLGHQPASGHAVEPVGRQDPSHAGRLEQRLGRGGRRAHGAVRAGHGYRRLGARSGRLVRHHRAQDHHRPHQHLWRAALEPDARHAWSP